MGAAPLSLRHRDAPPTQLRRRSASWPVTWASALVWLRWCHLWASGCRQGHRLLLSQLLSPARADVSSLPPREQSSCHQPRLAVDSVSGRGHTPLRGPPCPLSSERRPSQAQGLCATGLGGLHSTSFPSAGPRAETGGNAWARPSSAWGPVSSVPLPRSCPGLCRPSPHSGPGLSTPSQNTRIDGHHPVDRVPATPLGHCCERVEADLL